MHKLNFSIDRTAISLDAPQILESLPYPISIKTNDSIYVAANQALAKLTGFCHSKELIGLQDNDLRCDAAGLHGLFVAQDTAAIKGKKQSNLDICNYVYERPHAFLSVKNRLIDNNNKEYVISTMTEIPLVSLSKLMNHLSSKKVTRVAHLISSYCIDQPTVINSSNRPCRLTVRQSECLFYIMRGKTQKEISGLLNVSIRTVEEHIDNLKTVFECMSRSQLLNKAFELGFGQIIPPSLL